MLTPGSGGLSLSPLVQRCNHVSIQNNEVWDGGETAAGIFLHRSSDSAIVKGNYIHDMQVKTPRSGAPQVSCSANAGLGMPPHGAKHAVAVSFLLHIL